MNIFDILAESKIREWENREHENPPVSNKAGYQKSDSFEKQLLEGIQALIESSKSEDPERKTKTLEKAGDLEVQLMASLENQGLNLTARRIADQLSAMRAENS